MRFDTKDAAREHVWDILQEQKVARFPFPPHGRIPNFDGAERAAEQLFTLEMWDGVKRIKANPDAPQRRVRRMALERGITVYMPTPRLKGGFKRIDPADVPADRLQDAAALTRADEWATEVALDELPQMDLIVCGSVAVTRDGKRAGKGEGYSDLEYGILRELGHEPVPVVTTVHPLQLVDDLPREANDIPLAAFATPERIYTVKEPPPAPEGIDWDLLSDQDLDDMPVLKALRRNAAG